MHGAWDDCASAVRRGWPEEKRGTGSPARPDGGIGLFNPRVQMAGGPDLRDRLAPGAPAAAQMLGRSAPPPRHFGPAWRAWIGDAEARLRDTDWVHDLATDIGSLRWFRGLGTLIGLAAAALLFWPNFEPGAAAPAVHITSAERDEFRSQMI